MTSISMHNGSSMQLHEDESAKVMCDGGLFIRGRGYMIAIDSGEWKKVTKHNREEEQAVA